jgi:dolichol-phosphate mannosyltransferase
MQALSPASFWLCDEASPTMMREPQFRPKLSVVIPCYNEEAVMLELHRRVTQACCSVVKDSYELLFVNDGSFDGTWAMLEELAHKDVRVVGIDLSRNYGHQLALSAGLSVACGDRILIIDADLQDPPELLPDMMRLMDDGADVVYGQRVQRDGETWFKKISARTFYRLLRRMTNVAIPADTGDFRLISRQVLDALMAMPEQQRFIRGMVAWLGFHQVPIEYNRDARFAGDTKYSFYKMLTFAIDAITGFSNMPLRVSFYISCAFVVISLLLGIFVLFSWWYLGTVKGWASLLLVMLIFSSVQLFCLAIIGEYLGRVYMQTKQRPLFIIREIVSAPTLSRDVPSELGNWHGMPKTGRRYDDPPRADLSKGLDTGVPGQTALSRRRQTPS